MPRAVTIGLVQMHSTEDTAANLQKGLANIADAAKKGAQIVTLPELFIGPYFCQKQDKKYFELAEPIPGPSTDALCKAARENNVVVITSVYEKAADGKLFNTAVVIDADGTLLGTYRKIHIPNDPANGYDETYYFAKGDLGVKVFQTKYAKVAPQICYDQWFPEGARTAGLNGAEILFFPTAIGWPTMQREEWIKKAENEMWVTTQVSHGIDNNCFVVGVNRVKLEDGLDFWGTSFVSDPYGQILGKASTNQEEILIVKCNMDIIQRKAVDWPFFDDYKKAA